MIRLLLPVLACALLPTAMAQTVPPAEIGLSATRLNEITRMLQQACEEKRIAGAVAAVSRHGRVGYLQAVAQRDLQSAVPMTNDTLFRIASMTKAITSAAVMSLVEDGAISLDAPISVYLPEFGDQHTDEPSIHDLLTHRSGLTYGWFGPAELDALYTNNGINHLFEPTEESLSQRVARIARLPLKFRPRTHAVPARTLTGSRALRATRGLRPYSVGSHRWLMPLSV